MPASNPIRIDKSLFEQAAAEAERQKRSTPKQVEYWAELGQALDGLLSHADAVRLRQGLLKLAPADTAPVNPDAIFANLDAARTEGTLQTAINQTSPVYQASEQHPGYLEQINADGSIAVGLFERGKFKAKH